MLFINKRGKSFLYLDNNSYLKWPQIKSGMNFHIGLIFVLNSYDYIYIKRTYGTQCYKRQNLKPVFNKIKKLINARPFLSKMHT